MNRASRDMLETIIAMIKNGKDELSVCTYGVVTCSSKFCKIVKRQTF